MIENKSELRISILFIFRHCFMLAFPLYPTFLIILNALDFLKGNPRQSRILDSTLWIPDSGFQFLSVELEFWIPIVSGIPDSLSCIPDSKAQDSRFHQQKFPDSEILIPLHGVISIFFHYCLF